jgi:hypothetical protein
VIAPFGRRGRRTGHHPAGTTNRIVGSTAALAALGGTKGKATTARTAAAATTAATATTTAATPAAAGAATAVTTAARTAAIAIAVLGLGAGHQIDDVVEVALFLGAGGRILAAHHAHEAHVVGAIANHLERLHQPGEAVPLDVELDLDLGRRFGGRASRSVVDRRRFGARGRFTLGFGTFDGRRFATFGGRRLRRGLLGSAFSFTFGGGGRGGSSGGLLLSLHDRSGLASRLGGGLGGRLARVSRFPGRDRCRFRRVYRGGLLGRRFGRGRLAVRSRRLGRRGRAGGTVGAANRRRFTQQDAGELSDCLHGELTA